MNVSAFIVNGNWRRASSESPDLEAQTIAGTHTRLVLPCVPKPVKVAPAPKCTLRVTTNVIDDFFGATRPSQHDSSPPFAREFQPPPYADAQLPAYSADPNTEPITLAMYLFKFGFLFPPLWILGALVILSPLTVPADFESSKSGTDRQRMVQIMRDAEMKWAQRCAWAVLLLLLVGGGVTAIAIGILYA